LDDEEEAEIQVTMMKAPNVKMLSYELEREAYIAHNKAVMKDLGLMKKPAEEKRRRGPRQKRGSQRLSSQKG